MKKKVLVFSILCLLFITINYTYSSFQNTIVGNISATSNNWRFAVNVTNGIKENDYFKVPIGGTSGQVSITLNTTNSSNNVKYSIELSGYNLPSDIKYYKDSSYSTLISNNLYSDTINKNTSKTITIYYKSSSTISGYVYVKVKGNVYVKPVAMMKSRGDYGTEFWNDTYRPNIKTITFSSNVNGRPTNCTEANKCWDVSLDSNQEHKVYAYITSSNDLYIVSDLPIAPSHCGSIFYRFTNLTKINFNNYFDTSYTTSFNCMFAYSTSLTTIDLSSLDTSNITNVDVMFDHCTSLKTLDLSNFDFSKITRLNSFVGDCSSLTSIDFGNNDMSSVTQFDYTFWNCTSLSSLDLSKFDFSNAVNTYNMLYNCPKLSTTINMTSNNVTKYNNMFYKAATASGAKIIINYTSENSTLVDNMIATKSDGSNVVKGSVIS